MIYPSRHIGIGVFRKANGCNMTHKIKRLFFLLILLTFFVFSSYPQPALSSEKNTVKNQTTKEEIRQKEKINPYKKAKITTRIIPSVNKTFGYEIIVSGKILVHQPNIPALAGNDGFTTKERAQKVADFVVKKIRHNEMPPTVTVKDLNKMGVLEKISK